MPPWIELAWPAPSKIDAVYLTFDTDMNNRWHGTPLVPECVRDYELSYHNGRDWIPLVSETGNFQRRRVHRFAPVAASKLRLTIGQTNGAPSARVFEIRAYCESE